MIVSVLQGLRRFELRLRKGPHLMFRPAVFAKTLTLASLKKD